MAILYPLVYAVLAAFSTASGAPARVAESPLDRVAIVESRGARVALVTDGALHSRQALDEMLKRGSVGAVAIAESWADVQDGRAALSPADADVAQRIEAHNARSRHEDRVALHGYEPSRSDRSIDAVLDLFMECGELELARRIEPRLYQPTPAGLREVVRALDDRRRLLVARAGSHAFALARQHARVLEQATILRDLDAPGGRADERERFRAENIKWIADHEAPGRWIIVL